MHDYKLTEDTFISLVNLEIRGYPLELRQFRYPFPLNLYTDDLYCVKIFRKKHDLLRKLPLVSKVLDFVLKPEVMIETTRDFDEFEVLTPTGRSDAKFIGKRISQLLSIFGLVSYYMENVD